MQRTKMLILALGALLALGASACGGPGGEADVPEEVTLRLDWLPRANHAFFFLALENGFYEDEGLDVEILDGTGSGNAVTLVGSGQEEFGFASLVVLALAVGSEDVPVVSAAAITQHDPSSVLFRSDAGISEPLDLEGLLWGKTPGSSTEALFEAFAAQNGIDLASINDVSVEAAAKMTSLANGDIDMATSFGFQEIPLFAAQGVELDAFDFADYGVSVLGQGVVVNRQLLADRPELAQAFIDATLRGVEAMLDDPDAAVDALLAQRPDAGLDREIAGAQLDGYLAFLNPEGGELGWQDPADWDATQTVLEEYLDLQPGLDISTVYTNDFVDDGS